MAELEALGAFCKKEVDGFDMGTFEKGIHKILDRYSFEVNDDMTAAKIGDDVHRYTGRHLTALKDKGEIQDFAFKITSVGVIFIKTIGWDLQSTMHTYSIFPAVG